MYRSQGKPSKEQTLQLREGAHQPQRCYTTCEEKDMLEVKRSNGLLNGVVCKSCTRKANDAFNIERVK